MNLSKQFFYVVLALILITLGGCFSVGPDYSSPELNTPAQFNEMQSPIVKTGAQGLSTWWRVFNDPLLDKYIDEATNENLDIRIAIARVKEARSSLSLIAGEWFPGISADGQLAQSKPFPPRSGDKTTFQTNIGFTLNWELDLFGRISRSVESASAAYEASEEDRLFVLITIQAEVARTYLSIRQLQAQLASAENNIKAQKEILKLTKTRFDTGLASGLDVAQAERVTATSEAEIPVLRANLTKATNSLAILLGNQPGSLNTELAEIKPIPVPPEQTLLYIPAEMLRKRPDILAAERRLAAQTAQVGVATSALYPAFGLSGAFRYNTVSPGSQRDVSWTVAPFFSWSLLDFGRVRSSIAIEDAKTEQALLAYEQTVINALGEAENALRTYSEQKIRVVALGRALVAANKTLELATRLYADGLANFQNVLDAEQAVFLTDSQLQQAKGELATNLALLYKAFGGGWELPVAVETTTSPVKENFLTPSSLISEITK